MELLTFFTLRRHAKHLKQAGCTRNGRRAFLAGLLIGARNYCCAERKP